ncbi:MAG: hypothetical protein Q8K63_09290 [Acidimicrobiales bacterium]|nr:hypothetical protein [Acidimicrobiales bacterium]
MGKASNTKKVNRAAATGGGRTAGKRAPVGWYSSLFVVVVLGVAGVFFASSDLSEKQASADVTPPAVNKDHWHVAYGFNLCGKWAAPLKDGPAGDTTGIHTHEDGLIHAHPFVASVAGKNATFAKFMDDTDTSLNATSLNLKREDEKFKNGDKCGSKEGVLTARTFKNLADTTGTLLKGNPADWRIKDGTLITISFNPKGTKLTQPPSAGNLNDPGDLPGSTTSTSVPAEGATTTSTPAPTTSAP